MNSTNVPLCGQQSPRASLIHFERERVRKRRREREGVKKRVRERREKERERERENEKEGILSLKTTYITYS